MTGHGAGREAPGQAALAAAVGCAAAAVAAAAFFRADDGQPGQEGGGVRQRHGVCEVWLCRL